MINSTRIGGLLFLVLCCAYSWYATEIPLDYWSRQEVFTARSLPYFVGGAGALVAFLLIVSPSEGTDWRFLKDLNWYPATILVVLMSLYGLVMEPLGFPLATVTFLVCAWFTMGERRPHWLFGLAIPVALGFWLLMDTLGIYLYPGDIIETLFGTA
ncbi:MAG: tripartite tricarboxylate transporter TctB family protein [Pseudomonadales bacterium]|nr:tripartite tricarboxylate transporter TctB family protein [Pseudomonadales bacterium]